MPKHAGAVARWWRDHRYLLSTKYEVHTHSRTYVRPKQPVYGNLLQHQVNGEMWDDSFEGPFLRWQDWRKTSQWSMFVRQHAEVQPRGVHLSSERSHYQTMRRCESLFSYNKELLCDGRPRPVVLQRRQVQA